MLYMGITVRRPGDGRVMTMGADHRVGQSREDVAEMIDQIGAQATLQRLAPLWVRWGCEIIGFIPYEPLCATDGYAMITIA